MSDPVLPAVHARGDLRQADGRHGLGAEIDPLAAELFAGGREKSEQLPAVYQAIAEAAGEHFFDAGSVVSTDGVDGVHFSAETNATLGEAVAAEVEKILG